jgi:hypothetical protein
MTAGWDASISGLLNEQQLRNPGVISRAFH